MFLELPEALILSVICRCSDSLIPFEKSCKKGQYQNSILASHYVTLPKQLLAEEIIPDLIKKLTLCC